MQIEHRTGESNASETKPPSKRGFSVNPTTPLMRAMRPHQVDWLLNHCVLRHEQLDGGMGPWRVKMARYERMSEEDYSDRKTEADEVNDSSVKDIFGYQNETLGTVAGFFDFHFAQAKNDLFGTRPWLAATPEGKEDAGLADAMSKHAQWKFNQSDIEPALVDALKISTWGGTAFIKAAWLHEVETFLRPMPVAYDLEGVEILTPEGGLVADAEGAEALGHGEGTMEWKEKDVEDVSTVYENVSAGVVSYKDISFETTAPELSLRHTDVFVRFRLGLIDVMERYKIQADAYHGLLALMHGKNDEARAHRAETEPGQENWDRNANPLVTLVEGFVRTQVMGKMARVHVIFSPELRVLFRADYMANVTPGGILPVFPVRINRIPGRVMGVGYFEKYESVNKSIDRQFNSITFRNRTGAHVYTAMQPEALLDGGEGEEFLQDPTKPVVLGPGKKMEDFISFASAPDNSNRSEMLLNSVLQMAQMRSGITSASQGELKGVPSANTATGTNQLMSRGAVLIKAPVDEQTADIRAIVEFAVLMLYANQNTDETFTWGEGRDAELVNIKAADVLGIRANVTLTMTQSQNQQKLQSAMTAIDVVTKYVQVPEPEKEAVRQAFVQALNAVGFHNADDIIRQAATDPQGVLALMPPELQGIVMQAFEQAGVIAPPGETPQPSAPAAVA